MNAQTLTEKVIARATGRSRVTAGEEVWARPDRMIMNDSSGPRRIANLVDELGGVRDPRRSVLVSDHFTPAGTQRHSEILRITRDWARDHALLDFSEGQGILHNLLLERGLVSPGMLLVGADSHTCSAGAVGAVAVAVGSTELATVLATGEVWLRVPESIGIELAGELAAGVDLRDVTLRLLGDLSTEFANYRAIEYSGSFAVHLCLEDRLVLANQGIEMGAKNAVVVPSALVLDALGETRPGEDEAIEVAHPDAEAGYAERRVYDVGSLEPLIARHPAPDNVYAAADATDVAVDRVWIGSCVGGRLADLRAAARILKGREVRVPTTVTPATRSIYLTCAGDGTLAELVGAGCTVNSPGCGACAGIHLGVAADDEVIFSTGTRNFIGRMGSRSAQIHLGSAYTAAATAVVGHIADPRELFA